MIPKIILSTVLLSTLATSAFSQQVDQSEIKKEKKTKWVVGLGVGNSLMRNPIFTQFKGTGRLSEYAVGVNASLFARYYINDNLALESGLDGTYFMSRKHASIDHYTRAKYLLFEVPIAVQYHFFSSDAKFRPYMGVGVSFYHGISQYEEKYDVTPMRDNTSTYDNTDVLPFSFTQGFTYQVTDKLLLNQSLKYRLDAGAILNFNFGIGYTIGK